MFNEVFMENSRQIRYFSLSKSENNTPSTANVRILHTNVDTIEKVKVHAIMLNDKQKFVKCVEENCPLCNGKIAVSNKAYIHIFDYADNIDKVWVRPISQIADLQNLQNMYGDISSFVVTITRDDNAGRYPVYRIMPRMDSVKFSEVTKELIDEKVAYRFFLTRSAEEIQQYMNTGVMPERAKKFVSKQQYKEAKQSVFNPIATKTEWEIKSSENSNIVTEFDPFGGM